MVAQANASRFSALLMRSVVVVLTTAVAIGLFALLPGPQTSGVAALLAMVVCAWFGGLGPAVATPLLFVAAVRLFSGGPAALIAFSQKDLLDLLGVLFLTTVVGWGMSAGRPATAHKPWRWRPNFGPISSSSTSACRG
jgi:hypothetical protein